MSEEQNDGNASEVKTRDSDPWNQEVREAVRFMYDLQRVRIQVGGRPLQKEAGKKVELKPGDMGFVSGLHSELQRVERGAERHVSAVLGHHPMWGWLNEIRGIGPRMAGVILSEVDIRRAETVSALWRYAGCGVVRTDEGDAMRAERRKKGEKLAYNSFLKTKLLGVLADSFIKSGSEYREFYDNYKHRKESQGWGKSKGHRHNAAKRYMVKMFLKDLWEEWRAVEGLPVREPYQVQYLGHQHGGSGQ